MERNGLTTKSRYFSISLEELNVLFEFLNIIQQKPLQFVLMHDIFQINPSKLPRPLKNLCISFVFDPAHPGNYYMKAVLIPEFTRKQGYATLVPETENCNKGLQAFGEPVYYSDNRVKIDEDGRISLYCGSGADDFIAPGLTPLTLDDSQSFAASFLSFMELIELTLFQIIPGETLTITLNKSVMKRALNGKSEKTNTYVVKIAPPALQRALNNKQKESQSYSEIDISFIEESSLPELKMAAEYSVQKSDKVPLALKRVQNKNDVKR